MTDLDRPTRSAATFTLAGEVDVLSADAIRGAASLAASQAAGELRLDLAAVTFMDSQGVSALVDAHRSLSNRGIGLVVVHAPPQVVQLLTMTGLDQVLDLDG